VEGAASLGVIWIGIQGYFVPSAYRINVLTPLQVLLVVLAMVGTIVIDVVMMRGSREATVRWGAMPARAQYTLILIAVSFTWLMGLMGYVRSGLRLHWHVYAVVRDNSVDAFTPTLGFATQIVSVTVLIFFALIGLVFWLSGLKEKDDWQPKQVTEKASDDGAGGMEPLGATPATPMMDKS